LKLFFSEYKSDYNNYIFPYAIWAVPESQDKPADIFNKGFLPSSRDLDRYYMCRHVRVALKEFGTSSENRRILRKGEKYSYQLFEKSKFNFTLAWQKFCLTYAEQKFGENVMTADRLLGLINSPIVSHFLVYSDESHKDVGIIFLYLNDKDLVFYYYSFYDLTLTKDSLGMYMMTTAVDFFQKSAFDYLYLGSCYSRNALYKTQFSGAEFFNGFSWSRDISELKFLIDRDEKNVTKHLFENEEYLTLFHQGAIELKNQKNLFNI
jgi:hypothetical protein